MSERKPTTFRQRDLVRAVRGTLAAGLPVKSVMVDRDGSIVVVVGEPVIDVTAEPEENDFDKP